MTSLQIDKRKEELENLDELIESIFYDTFGDPVKNDKGWEVKKLGEFGEFKNGINFFKNSKGNVIRYIGVGDFQTLFKISDFKFLNEAALEEPLDDVYFLQKEDILFVRSNGNKNLVGRSIIVYPGENKIIFSGFCIRFRKYENNINIIFLNSQFKYGVMKNRLSKSVRGANIQNLNQKILSNLEIILPPYIYKMNLQKKLKQ
ncbi:restriction endonuclease subunit S [Allofustis seminis]|uniref:restriction endonuclease subunit S n=1 Tax=Allofustis seminis TaxID=166939 RepID=UPI00036BF265|nr:restriction endonuclease subunit S [Allofustis seminis]